ncbi:hypothetical protein BHE74_00019049, partial [Ensete ventricosum]
RRLIPSPNAGRLFFSSRGEKKSPAGKEIACGRQIARAKRTLGISLSSSFSLPRLIPPEIGQRRSKSTVTNRFRVVTGGPHTDQLVDRCVSPGLLGQKKTNSLKPCESKTSAIIASWGKWQLTSSARKVQY